MVIVADVLSGVLVFVFTGGSVGKLAHAKAQAATAERLHMRWDRYRLIAIPEAAAVIGLLLGFAVVPLGAAAATGIAVLMLIAATMRVAARNAIGFVVGDLIICGVAIATAVLRATSG
jgi:DoxX-like family